MEENRRTNGGSLNNFATFRYTVTILNNTILVQCRHYSIKQMSTNVKKQNKSLHSVSMGTVTNATLFHCTNKDGDFNLNNSNYFQSYSILVKIPREMA